MNLSEDETLYFNLRRGAAELTFTMTFDWQLIVVYAVVAAAAAYLARRVWLAMSGRKAGGCGKCATCPSSATDAAPAKQLVSLDEQFGELTRR